MRIALLNRTWPALFLLANGPPPVSVCPAVPGEVIVTTSRPFLVPELALLLSSSLPASDLDIEPLENSGQVFLARGLGAPDAPLGLQLVDPGTGDPVRVLPNLVLSRVGITPVANSMLEASRPARVLEVAHLPSEPPHLALLDDGLGYWKYGGELAVWASFDCLRPNCPVVALEPGSHAEKTVAAGMAQALWEASNTASLLDIRIADVAGYATIATTIRALNLARSLLPRNAVIAIPYAVGCCHPALESAISNLGDVLVVAPVDDDSTHDNDLDPRWPAATASSNIVAVTTPVHGYGCSVHLASSSASTSGASGYVAASLMTLRQGFKNTNLPDLLATARRSGNSVPRICWGTVNARSLPSVVEAGSSRACYDHPSCL